MLGILNLGKDRLINVMQYGIDIGREFILGADGTYRWMLRNKGIKELLEDRHFQFLSRFGPVHYFQKENEYLVTDFEVADHILKQDRLFIKFRQTPLDPSELYVYGQPDRHTKSTALIRACITKDILKDTSVWLRELSIRVFEQLPVNEKFDWYKRFCMPTVFYSTCHILGFEHGSAEVYFKKAGEDVESNEFYEGFKDWCVNYLEMPHVEGDNRMLNSFRKYVSEGHYTRDEALDLLLLMFIGALKTTSSLLAVLSRALMSGWSGIEPMQLLDEQLLTRYMEENLRLNPVLPRIARRVAADTEVSGVTFKKGARLFLDVRATNRDPKRFQQPEEASFSFNHPRQLTFGSGMHQCIGMHMARYQMRVVLPTLLERIGSVRHIASKWAIDADDLHFYHPHFFICKRSATSPK
jgi:cytochrome P450